MNYKTEHPDFTLPEGITIPDGFVDTSRSNHLCPNWTDYNNNIVLFIDYEDGEMGARFTLNFDSLDQDGMVSDQWQDWNDIEICDNPLCCFRSNHWKAILKAISKQPNRKDSKMKKYHIAIPEVHIAYYEVSAKSANDAVQIAKSCDGDAKLLDVAYSHDLKEEIEIIQDDNTLSYLNEVGEVTEK